MARSWSGAYGTLPPWQRSGTSTPGGDIIQQLSDLEKQRNTDVKARETEVRTLLDQIIGSYSPGGGFGQGTEKMLDIQKKKDVASASQGLVSAGLANTTVPAGLSQKWEAEVGMPSRAKLEDVRYGALAQAIANKAQFITDIQNQMPDYAMLANLIAQGQGIPGMTAKTTGGWG